MNVERRRSNIHGDGVFARQPIEEGSWTYIYGEISYKPDEYCFEHEEWFWLPYPPWKWLNHSENPNCEFDFCDEECMLVVWAKRLIIRNAELTIDYGYTP